MNLGTWIYTKMFGELIGEDEYGNQYFRAKKRKGEYVGRISSKERRWVVYNGKAEASKIPPYWHGWMHHVTDHVPTEKDREKSYDWERGHLPNMTGTDFAYRPNGHMLKGGKRDKATGDYQAWKP